MRWVRLLRLAGMPGAALAAGEDVEGDPHAFAEDVFERATGELVAERGLHVIEGPDEVVSRGEVDAEVTRAKGLDGVALASGRRRSDVEERGPLSLRDTS